ncbi:phage gp45-like [Bradyrhizobium barranii subsp. barranii]|uniref:phage baseplate assembly protein domain-containing protein n=1 Tax=Bradyrhizobium TaxID=374 RepID=UPI001BAAE37A|nr:MULTISPECIES: phage baseplate assembly protein [Bradyrhizobium]MBR0879612.1 phage baseplate assembly protein [Bradyrhizobium liaoningense]MCP1778836.1 phage gp45-like [Bradyrhizobium japonicum]MCP1958166.1 phage gp45-like [Bradyrhizobium japonicum]
MHRATPLNSSFVGYVSGGARSVVDKVDDTKLMQEMGGNFMANETRQAIEAAQNYGFSSVVFDAEKGKDGKIQGSAETFMNFNGGNRSFPSAGNMDDRRHRMFKLEKGDTAMFRGRGDKQQFHMTKDGGFWTAPQDKTVRMHLVEKDSEKNDSVQQHTEEEIAELAKRGIRIAPLAEGGQESTTEDGKKQKRGQEALYKDGQKSKRFVEVTKDKTRMGGAQCHMVLDDEKTYVHAHSDKNVYLGAEAGKGSFDFLVTLSGPCVNSKGKIG